MSATNSILLDRIAAIIAKANMWDKVPESHTKQQEEHIRLAAVEILGIIRDEQVHVLKLFDMNYCYFSDEIMKFVIDSEDISEFIWELEEEKEKLL